MAPSSTAIGPGVVVSAVAGRYAPIMVVDKRNIYGIPSSTPTSCQMAYIFRADSASNDFQTPLTDVSELGTQNIAGMYDDIAESKVSVNVHDVSKNALSLLTGLQATGGQTYGFNELNAAEVDIVRQYAAQNGTVFASEFNRDLVIDGYTASLKKKGDAMEMYSLQGFNAAKTRNFIVTKAIVAASGDVTNNYLAVASVLGVDEAPVAITQAAGKPAMYWLQNGCIYFLKIERFRATGNNSGATVLTEVPYSGGTVTTGVMAFDSATGNLHAATGDIVAGDVFLLTYRTYKSDVTSMSTLSGITGINFGRIPQNTLDTSDPAAISTRLTPIVFNGYKISRGSSLDIKLNMKRDRVEGIGDVAGIYGPSDPPEVTVDLEVAMTGIELDALLQNGTPLGTNDGGNAYGDFIDPNYMTRIQLGSPTDLSVSLYSPIDNSLVKTVTAKGCVFGTVSTNTPSKGEATQKFGGKSQFGSLEVS